MSQQNQNAAVKQPFDWKQLLAVLNADGQAGVVQFVRDYRDTHGPQWLAEIKAEFPFASWLLDLVANHSADDAVDQIAAAYPYLPVRALAGDKLKRLHAKLLYEIEVKR